MRKMIKFFAFIGAYFLGVLSGIAAAYDADMNRRKRR